MKKSFFRKMNITFAVLLGLVVLSHRNVQAQSHVVSPAQIQNDVASVSTARQQNETQVKSFLSSPEALRAMQSAHIDANQVTKAVSQLNHSDLAQLAARSQTAQKDFAAGSLSNRDMLIILVAVAALFLIIVAVH